MISEFFENSEIFITGGSGVVGKALIEKLLRSCNVKKIYILLRSKKNASIEERLETVKQGMVFRQLKLVKPGELDLKLQAIPGDALEPMLGITPEYQKLMQNVSIIFHCAATVRFNEPLRDALKLNVGGTLETLKFAESLKYLKVFMHVSTFFSNPYLKKVEEKVYKPPMDWQFCLNLLERKDISEEQLDVLTRKLTVGFPNSYCFTKNLAESLVNDYRHKLPLAIYRPSIVLFTLHEPEPGFAPSLTGAMGLFAVAGAGILKTVYIDKNTRLDLTPQDVGINTLCYYTAKTGHLYEDKKRPAELPVYIASSYKHSDFTFPQYVAIVQDYGFWVEAAFEKNVLIPHLYCTGSRLLYMAVFFLKQILIALLLDFVLILMGRKPLFMRAQRQVFNTLEVMKPFCFNNYESNGLTDIEQILKVTKGTEFNIESIAVGKDFYKTVGLCRSVIYCVREHLFKEDPKTLPKARRIMNMKIWIYKTIKFLLAVKFFNILMDYASNFYYEKLFDTTNSTTNAMCHNWVWI